MIPRRAFFYWDRGSPPMSWLRRLCLTSFECINPDWEIVILDGADIQLPGAGLLPAVHRSDWARYQALYDRGGVYFDSDMLFLRPIPDSWLAGNLLLAERVSYTAQRPEGEYLLQAQVSHVAVLGGAKRSNYFGAALDACVVLAEQNRALGYQAFGVNLLSQIGQYIDTDPVYIPNRLVLPVRWDRVVEIWNKAEREFPADTIALHWFGGDPLSQHLEPQVDSQWVEQSNSLLAQTIRLSRVNA